MFIYIYICSLFAEPPLTEPPHIEGYCPNLPESEENQWIPSGDSCYYFVMQQEASWLGAMEDCMKRDRDARLVSVHHKADNDKLLEVAVEKMHHWDSHRYDYVWLGMFRGKGLWTIYLKYIN